MEKLLKIMRNNNKKTTIIIFITIILILTYIPRMKEMFQEEEPAITSAEVESQDMSGIINAIRERLQLTQKHEDDQQRQDDRLLRLEKRLKRIF